MTSATAKALAGAPTLILTRGSGARAGSWVGAVFGLVFGLSGFAEGLSAAIPMWLFGLLFVVAGSGTAVSRLDCSHDELRYRGLWTVRVAASDVDAVNVQWAVPGGYGSHRVRIDIHRTNARPLKLNGLMRRDTPENRRKAEDDADEIRRVLGLSSGELSSS